MRKQKRAAVIAEELARLFPETPIPLRHRDPFTLLVAVLLSAQCTDERVNRITPKLFARAADSRAMARMSIADVQQIVRPCGLAPQKAKAIVGLAKMLVAQHDGEVPESFDALEELPGVGHKTASVVMSQAFGHAAFPVDTHIHRLAQVWGLSDGSGVVQTERDLKRLFPPEQWHALHLRCIFYGREYCQARGCDGLRCHLCQRCFPRRRTPVVVRRP